MKLLLFAFAFATPAFACTNFQGLYWGKCENRMIRISITQIGCDKWTYNELKDPPEFYTLDQGTMYVETYADGTSNRRYRRASVDESQKLLTLDETFTIGNSVEVRTTKYQLLPGGLLFYRFENFGLTLGRVLTTSSCTLSKP